MSPRRFRRLPSRRPNGGFTLIEILVVVFIAGVLLAVAVLSLGALGDDRDVEREARRIQSLIQLAGDEAELQGRDFGIEFVRQGYRFVEYDPLFEQWSEIIGDEVLRPRSLPDGYEMALFIEDRQVKLNEEAAVVEYDEEEDNDSRREQYAPHGLILSSGDISPLDVDIIRLTDGTTVRLRIDLNGNVELNPDDDSDV